MYFRISSSSVDQSGGAHIIIGLLTNPNITIMKDSNRIMTYTISKPTDKKAIYKMSIKIKLKQFE